MTQTAWANVPSEALETQRKGSGSHMLQRLMCRLGLVTLLAACAAVAAAQDVSRIRLMLHPYAAAPGELPSGALAKLQALAGLPLELSGTTRTGGLEFTLGQPVSPADAAALLRRLREDRSVLWAESIDPPTAKAKALKLSPFQGRKLMVRLVGDAAPDWSVLLPRWTDLVGMPLGVERQIGNVWVMTLSEPVPEDLLDGMAEQLQIDTAVQYADPVRRAFPTRIPNDPLYSQQWALKDATGVNAPTAWDLQIGSASVTVAVIDTGITQHPDLEGRILPGYDFISDPITANDGNGRDADPSDPGDGTGDNECGDGIPGEPSFFHGTFVSGIIAADTDNGVGVAGLDWNAKILPVRTLGKCGGSFDDILDGVLWAAGVPVAGVPPNPNPARVINMSLGGLGSCPQSLQDAVNAALGQGAVIVVSAGNASEDTIDFSPANCSGVITIGASTRQGDITSYSNFGKRVDLSAPGGDGSMTDWILSTGNDGTAGPGNPDYEFAVGTSRALCRRDGIAHDRAQPEPHARPHPGHHHGHDALVRNRHCLRYQQLVRCGLARFQPRAAEHDSGHKHGALGHRRGCRILSCRQGSLLHVGGRGRDRVPRRGVEEYLAAHGRGLLRLGRSRAGAADRG
ncbi:MAG: hypothetical protein E6H55_11360, partial [Betaproteobacteria bacterium]